MVFGYKFKQNKVVIELTVTDDRKFVISEKVGYKGYKDY
jgi:hypothetical protein